MKAPDTTPTATIATASQKLQVLAALEQPNAGDANAAKAEDAAAAQSAAPLPPRKPSEFMLTEAGFGDAPMPPARPVEFASAPSLSMAIPPGPAAADSFRRSDLIAALLARKLPSVITKGAGGAVPAGTLALAEFEGGAPEPPERPAALAKAAALSAALPPSDSARLSPLARAALLSAPLPPAHTAPKSFLVAARIDRSNFSVMTAAPAKAQGKANPGPRIVAVAASAHPDALMAMLTPNVQALAAFAAQPYGDLRSDAFTGPAVKPLLDNTSGAGDPINLRGPAD
jgi:hypothetical protein